MERIGRSPYKGLYDQDIDRESAYEMLKQKAAQMAEISAQQQKPKARRGRQSASEAMLKAWRVVWVVS